MGDYRNTRATGGINPGGAYPASEPGHTPFADGGRTLGGGGVFDSETAAVLRRAREAEAAFDPTEAHRLSSAQTAMGAHGALNRTAPPPARAPLGEIIMRVEQMTSNMLGITKMLDGHADVLFGAQNFEEAAFPRKDCNSAIEHALHSLDILDYRISELARAANRNVGLI